MKYDITPEERTERSATRWAAAGFALVAILAVLFIASSPRSDAAAPGAAQLGTAAQIGVQVPRCAEDQVISKRLRCLTYDNPTTRYQVVSEAGWGYWYDSRYPRARSMRPLIVACHRWQMVTRFSGCVATVRGDFRHGWWYHR